MWYTPSHTMSEKFVALFDLHWGYERRGGHKVPLHDARALGAALNFVADFKPNHVILGGDMLDCGVVSHHNHGRPGAIEGLKLISDAKELVEEVITPLENTIQGRLIYHVGNHEDWLTDLTDLIPSLEGLIEISNLLDLSDQWEVVPQGEASKLGKLTFLHGDQIRGGENVAKSAVVAYERNFRFGHHHTFQAYTKTSAVDMNGHTGISVPCLCKKGPRYGEGAPNKWMQGFLWGYVGGPDGIFNDYVSVIVNGKFIANGKVYKG